jgi:acetyl-CoA carboxylase biotin carboxyl carrier protein
MPVQNAAPVAAVVDTPVVEENKYITIKSPIIGTFIENQLQTNLCLLSRYNWKGDVLCVIEA